MIKFLYTNKFDTATVTALNEATGYDAVNVQDRFLKKTWRSTGVSNQWLKFDLGSAQLVSMFTFFNNNLTTAATVKLYGHASDLGSTEAAWSGASFVATISSFDSTAAYIAAGGTFRYWLLAFTDASNPNGYIQVGRVYGGVSISPDENFSEDFQETSIDPSLMSWTIGQHLYSVQRERYKEFQFVFSDITAANQLILRTLWASVYKTEPFVIALDETDQPVGFTRYGVLTSDLNFSYSPYNRATCSMSFRELR